MVWIFLHCWNRNILKPVQWKLKAAVFRWTEMMITGEVTKVSGWNQTNDVVVTWLIWVTQSFQTNNIFVCDGPVGSELYTQSVCVPLIVFMFNLLFHAQVLLLWRLRVPLPELLPWLCEGEAGREFPNPQSFILWGLVSLCTAQGLRNSSLDLNDRNVGLVSMGENQRSLCLQLQVWSRSDHASLSRGVLRLQPNSFPYLQGNKT